MRFNRSVTRQFTCAGICLLFAWVPVACTPKAGTPAANATPQASSAPPAIVYAGHLAADGIAPPGAQLHNPHEGDPAFAKSGAVLFTAMNCDGCHGGDAAGWVGPNLGDGRWHYGGAPGEIFTSIYYGRPRGMPAFGGALGPEGVWTLVTYLKSLPAPADEPTESFEKP
jgi:cytochrome c oxidase cbb3-type subunit 3